MSIRITGPDRGPYPRPVIVTLICEGDHGMFPVERAFQHEDGFMGAMRLAMDAGWKDTSASGERKFFGPCCSGKPERT